MIVSLLSTVFTPRPSIFVKNAYPQHEIYYQNVEHTQRKYEINESERDDAHILIISFTKKPRQADKHIKEESEEKYIQC